MDSTPFLLQTKKEITAASEGSSVKFNKVDLKILEITGQDSSVLDAIVEDEVAVTEEHNYSQQTHDQINRVVPHFADVQNLQSGLKSSVGHERVPITKPKIGVNDYLSQKRKLTLELLNHDIYLRKLEALKLEKELGLKRSEYTQELLSQPEAEKEIKNENTCEMEFEY